MKKTAEELRARAAASEQRAVDSWERSDTDGFVSQWASGISAREDRANAAIADNGGVSTFRALADAETGELVPAVWLNTRYGGAWALFATADDANAYGANIIAWVSGSARTQAKKGFREVWVERRAKAVITSSGRGLSGAATAYVREVPDDGMRFNADARIMGDAETGTNGEDA